MASCCEGQSGNSFDRSVDDWQNVPEVKQFYQEDWDDIDDSIRVSPTFQNSNSSVNPMLKYSFEHKKVKEEIRLRTSIIPGKELEFYVDDKEVKLQWDAGFKQSLKLGFNPYYKLSISRRLNQFQEASVGLNYVGDEGTTHHEVSLVKGFDETKIKYQNSYLMSWRIFKYCALNTITYGKEILDNKSHIISAHPIPQLDLLMIYNDTETGESNYNLGARFALSPYVSLFANTHINSEYRRFYSLGASWKFSKRFSGKAVVNDFEKVWVYLRSQISNSLKVSGGVKLDLSAGGGKSDIKLGLKIEKDF